MVVMDAAGVIAGDGWERLQRQIPVHQTAGETQGERAAENRAVFVHLLCFNKTHKVGM